MTRETTEELRARLLRDEEVRNMIAMRAYEIYQLRGQEPGHQAEDWFQAESEVLAFLIEEESRRADEASRPGGQGARDESEAGGGGEGLDALGGVEPALTPETSDRKYQPNALTAAERAESQSVIGAWSPSQPDSAQTAPSLGSTVAESPATKKPGAGSASKTTPPRKGKATAGSPRAAQKGASKNKPAPKGSTEDAPRLKKARRQPAEE